MNLPEEERRPKVLVVAEHASARFGGEALIPFQYFKCLRQQAIDVHLLVHARTRAELMQAFPDDTERLHFVADSVLNRVCYHASKYLPARVGVFTLGAISHFETQIRQRRVARRLVREHRFDVVHEPIPVSPKLPSLTFGLSAPVIIGPMNGGMNYPPNYDVSGTFERWVVSCLRSSARVSNMILPGKRRASLLLVANSRTRSALPVSSQPNKILEFVENGVDTDLFRPASCPPQNEALRIVFVGRLVDWKRIDLMLEACAQAAQSIRFAVDVVGDGPLRAQLQKQVVHLGLDQGVRFHGRLAHAQTAELLRRSDLLVLPSMYESGGAVVLEAMASGLPVIATKWGGPTDYITPATGVLIDPEKPETFVRSLATAIVDLAGNREACRRMGQAGRERAVALYDWHAKARKLTGIYIKVARRSSSQPATVRI